jgi:integrase
MQGNRNARRQYGTGSIIEYANAYYGKWRVGDRQIKRKLGPIRKPGSREGLTRKQAEAKLREAMAEVGARPVAVRDSPTVGDAGKRLLDHLRALGRKPSTLESYESALRVHLVVYFGARPLAKLDADDVEAFAAWMQRQGRSPKTTRNTLGFLHSIFDYAMRRGWVAANPCKLIDKPQKTDGDADIRFLDPADLEALIGATPDSSLGRVDRSMYLAAAMTGMRQGELLALPWMDVDWLAGRVRVRRSFVRGQYGAPKSKRSTRSVPLADRLASELDRLHRGSSYDADSDLVFAHPETGKPLDRSKLLKRYKAALKRAAVREVRFHDLRHTFGTRMAAEGVPMRTLQEWMGHRDLKTTLVYADYAPSAREAEWINAAFGTSGTNGSTNLSATRSNSDALDPL